jgi:Tfp pilus assembly protein PilF
MSMDGESNNQKIENRERARDLWELGVQQLMSGHIRAAVDSFNRSLAVHPTAEGFTYRGWAISFLGRLEEAIEDCKRAIRVDPEFGNPYNDIGVYLMQMGALDQAIPWLEKAKSARRYEPKHFPFLNLGHIFMAQGDQMRALEEYVKALDIDPENEVALKAIAGMDLQVN